MYQGIGRGADTVAAAVLGAGEVDSVQSILVIKLIVKQNNVIGFNVFFLPAAGWDYMPTYGRFLFYFLS